jgi:hypothetical protein
VTAAAHSAVEHVSYEDLYVRWERSNWSATAIDFTRDAVEWRERFDDFERRAILWNFALFFSGEDSVADNLSPYIEAAPREEQKYFLTTQQVDEARHAVFFKRFMHEVAGVGDGSVAGGLGAVAPQLTWGYRMVFGRLDRMAGELRRDRSKPKLAAAIALYHLVIEAGLAQAGQHAFEAFLTGRDLLPGFREGIHNVAMDEQRHIAFGVKLLHDLCAEDPRCLDAVADLLREVQPWTTAILQPPDGDRRWAEVFGMTMEELFATGARSMEARFQAAGVPLASLPGPESMPLDLEPEERAHRGVTLLLGGILGEKVGPPRNDYEIQSLLFDSLRRSVDPRKKVSRPRSVQWEFSDADPWYLVVDNGSSRVSPGRLPDAELTFRSTWEDWVDVSMERLDPRRALLTRRLRARGGPRALLGFAKLFA